MVAAVSLGQDLGAGLCFQADPPLSISEDRMLSQHDQNDQSSLISAEDEELVDEYHAQLLWLYSEYGTGWVVPKAERERLTKKHGLVWCVCFSEYGVTTLWESRATTHGDGDCCCWCESLRGLPHLVLGSRPRAEAEAQPRPAS